MCSQGIACGPGVGLYLAEWIVNGERALKVNMLANDIRRFVDMHNNRNFLQERVTESLGMSTC